MGNSERHLRSGSIAFLFRQERLAAAEGEAGHKYILARRRTTQARPGWASAEAANCDILTVREVSKDGALQHNQQQRPDHRASRDSQSARPENRRSSGICG